MGIDDYAATLIRIKARELVKTGGVPPSERKDVEQELKLDLIQRLRHCDPQRGSRATFYRVVVERRIASIIERRRSRTRKPSSPIRSLQTVIGREGDEELELADIVEGDRGKREDFRDLCSDLAEVLDGLPPKLRRLCRMLPDRTTTEIAEELGVNRKTISRWKAELQERFRNAGLEEYL
jgi:RNA polymerase sigma-70 factor (ECF subfamily)